MAPDRTRGVEGPRLIVQIDAGRRGRLTLRSGRLGLGRVLALAARMGGGSNVILRAILFSLPLQVVLEYGLPPRLLFGLLLVNLLLLNSVAEQSKTDQNRSKTEQPK